ncbi:MAG: ATP-binding protein [Betaproteobacteria bacterium]
MIRSFRIRLALYSALLAGLALATFGFSSLWLIRNVKIENLDRTIRSHAEREAGRPPLSMDWVRVESDMANGLGEAGEMLLLVQDGDGETIYQSMRWPDVINAKVLPWPDPATQAQRNGKISYLISEVLAVEGDAARSRPPPRDFRPDDNRPPPADGRPPPRERLPLYGDERPRPPLPQQGDERFHPPKAESRSRSQEPDKTSLLPVETPRLPLPLPEAALNVQVDRPAPWVSREREAPQPRRGEMDAPGQQSSRPVSTVVGKVGSGQTWRIGLARTERSRVAVAVSLKALDAEMHGIRIAFLLAMPVALFLIGLGAWLVSRRALRPVEKLTQAACRITAEGLGERLPVAGEDREFVELIKVFNQMLERLERSFRQAHRFTADAAHELKTPLAILQGQLERAIGEEEAGSAVQIELSGILDEVRRLSTISRKLLLLSQADAGKLSLNRQAVNLSEVLTSLVEDTQMLAPHLNVSAVIQPDLVVSVDGALLLQVLHNLISNAIKYNVDDGWITLSAKRWPRQVDVFVSNASAGIPLGERGKIFERFYRADQARSRDVEGLGLGLALSREIVRAHGGELTYKVIDDNCVEFCLMLRVDGS